MLFKTALLASTFALLSNAQSSTSSSPPTPSGSVKKPRSPSRRCDWRVKVLPGFHHSRCRRDDTIPILPSKPLCSPIILRQAVRTPRADERHRGFLVRLHAGVLIQHHDANLLHPCQRHQADMVLLRHRQALSGWDVGCC